MSKIIKTQKTTRRDAITGEIVDTEIEEHINFGKTDQFIMLFLKDLSVLYKLTQGEMIVLMGFLQVINNDNIIYVTKGLKDAIADASNGKVKKVSINQLVSNLKRKKFIIKIDTGRFYPNPHIFGRGKWNNIKKLRMQIEYDFENSQKTQKIETDNKVDG